MALSIADTEAVLYNPPPETNGFHMQQTMIRIKDPMKSLEFYTKVLGMRLLKRMEFPGTTFTLFLMGYAPEEDIPKDEDECRRWLFSQRSTLELTHNWGTENDANQSYHNGNSDPEGFGHIGICVPDVYSACERFERLGVSFINKPDPNGKFKGVAFIQDPDGYWIEVIDMNSASE